MNFCFRLFVALAFGGYRVGYSFGTKSAGKLLCCNFVFSVGFFIRLALELTAEILAQFCPSFVIFALFSVRFLGFLLYYFLVFLFLVLILLLACFFWAVGAKRLLLDQLELIWHAHNMLCVLPLEIDAETLGLCDVTMVSVLWEDAGGNGAVSEVALLVVVDLPD